MVGSLGSLNSAFFILVSRARRRGTGLTEARKGNEDKLHAISRIEISKSEESRTRTGHGSFLRGSWFPFRRTGGNWLSRSTLVGCMKLTLMSIENYRNLIWKLKR